MTELVTDPEMAVTDTSDYGDASPGGVSWEYRKWSKRGGALLPAVRDGSTCTINIASKQIGGHKYRYQYEITGYQLGYIQFGGASYTGSDPEIQVGVHVVDITMPEGWVNSAFPEIASYPDDEALSKILYFRVHDLMAETNLYATLSSYAGLTALVNNGDSPMTYRIFPLVMPQDITMPAVVYQRIVGNRVLVMDDNGGSAPERIVFQLTAWAKTMLDSIAVMEQVRLALAAASYEVVPLGNRSTYEPETRLYGMEYDFAMWHRN